MRSKAGYCVHSQLANLSRIEEPHSDSPWKRWILKARWVSYHFPSSWVLRCVFLCENFLKVSASGQSDVRSGNSRPPVAWWSRTFYIRSSKWIIPNNAQAQSVDYPRVERSMLYHTILITAQRVVIEVPECTSGCPEAKTFKKVSHKKHIAIPMMG